MRADWQRYRQPYMRKAAHRLVFLDETAINTKMVRLRGRCARSERLHGAAPFGHWISQTFIAGLRHDGLSAPWVIDGPMNKAIFESYVRTQLAPTLRKGDIVICDNLSSHKSKKAQQYIRERGAHLMFLPPYSPDLNPIEMAFAKLKSHLRKAAARNFDDLFDTLGSVCKLFEPEQCYNFFKAANYAYD